MNHEPWAEDWEKPAQVQDARRVPPAPRTVQVSRECVTVELAGEDGSPRRDRGIFFYALLSVFVFLMLVAAMLSDQRAAVAAQSSVAVSPALILQQGMVGGPVEKQRPPEEGGSLTVRDWLDHLPVVLVAVVVVVGVDAATIIVIRRNRQRSQGSA